MGPIGDELEERHQDDRNQSRNAPCIGDKITLQFGKEGMKGQQNSAHCGRAKEN